MKAWPTSWIGIMAISHAPAENYRIGQVRACGAGLQLREAGLMQVLVVAGAIWRGRTALIRNRMPERRSL